MYVCVCVCVSCCVCIMMCHVMLCHDVCVLFIVHLVNDICTAVSNTDEGVQTATSAGGLGLVFGAPSLSEPGSTGPSPDPDTGVDVVVWGVGVVVFVWSIEVDSTPPPLLPPPLLLLSLLGRLSSPPSLLLLLAVVVLVVLVLSSSNIRAYSAGEHSTVTAQLIA